MRSRWRSNQTQSRAIFHIESRSVRPDSESAPEKVMSAANELSGIGGLPAGLWSETGQKGLERRVSIAVGPKVWGHAIVMVDPTIECALKIFQVDKSKTAEGRTEKIVHHCLAEEPDRYCEFLGFVVVQQNTTSRKSIFNSLTWLAAAIQVMPICLYDRHDRTMLSNERKDLLVQQIDESVLRDLAVKASEGNLRIAVQVDM